MIKFMPPAAKNFFGKKVPGLQKTPGMGILIVLGIIAIAGLISILWNVYTFGVDDSYIFYRYAENISNGHGFVFNIGEPAGEGFTSWIWTLLLAFFYKIGIDIIFISKTMGILFHVLSAGLLYTLIKRITIDNPTYASKLTAALLSVAFLLSYRSIAHSVSGMETSLYIFSILLLTYITTQALLAPESDMKCWKYIGIATMGAFLVRPEGIAAGGISLLALAIKQRHDLLKIKTWLILTATLAAPLALFIIMKIAVFGYPLPHSFYHKFIRVNAEYGEAFKQFRMFITSYWWLIIPAIVIPIYTAAKNKKYFVYYYPGLFLAMITVYLLFYPTMNYNHRFYIPYVPMLLAAVSLLLVTTMEKINGIKNSAFRVFSVSIVLAAFVWGMNWDMSGAQNQVKSWTRLVNPTIYRARLGKIMSDLPRDVTAANTEMGVIPYYSGLTCIDMAGLTDPYIAHHGLNIDYFIKRNTDIILFPHKVETLPLPEWETFGINYKAIFLTQKFKNDFENIGYFEAWPGHTNKYYIYVDKTSPRYREIKKWREKYANEFSSD